MTEHASNALSLLTPLSPAAIRARRCPLAVFVVFATELMWALLVATPAHAWAARVWGAHPDGDAVLFAPGGRQLLVWLGSTDAGMIVTLRTTIVLLFVGAVLMQLPLGALLASLAFARETADVENEPDARTRMRAPHLVTALQVGIAAFMPLCGLLVVGTAAAIAVVGAGAALSSAVDRGVASSMGDARAFAMRVVTFGLFLLIAAVIGVIVDLARAAVGREVGLNAARGARLPAWTLVLRGLRSALSVARHGLLRAMVAWAWRSALGIALVAVGAYMAHLLGGKGGPSLTMLFVLHQMIVLGRTSLRSAWLARAVALVAPMQSSREEEKPVS